MFYKCANVFLKLRIQNAHSKEPVHCPCQMNKLKSKKKIRRQASEARDSERGWNGRAKARFKLREAVLLETILPLQRLLSEPVSLPEASQVDGLSVGQVLPRDINLPNKEEKERRESGVTAGK